ncbi:hypothetical protein [Mucilaginibacter sp.]|jgi:hypothetical protein
MIIVLEAAIYPDRKMAMPKVDVFLEKDFIKDRFYLLNISNF